METGSGFNSQTVLPGWARSMITRVPKFIKNGKNFRDPRLAAGMPGDRPLVPHGRFMVETDGNGILSITGMPSWTEGEPLKEPKPLASVRVADARILLDPGFVYDDATGNARRLLLMFAAKGWDDAMPWILGHSDVGMLGKWASMCNNLPGGGRCEPLGLLSRLAERGGPDHAGRRYMTIINRKCRLSIDAFSIIETICSEPIGTDWETSIPADLEINAARLHKLKEDPALIASMSRVLRLALARDRDKDTGKAWGMVAGLVGGRSDALLRLADHLDDDRAGFVALSMLHTQSMATNGGRWNTPMLPRYLSEDSETPALGDVCLSEWNPFDHMHAQDKRFFESPAVQSDVGAWIDSTASMHSDGGNIGVERVRGMAAAAMDVIQISMDAVDSSMHDGYEPGRRPLDGIPIVALATIMNGDEPEGAGALAEWVGANKTDTTGMRDIILNGMLLLTYRDDRTITDTRDSVEPILRMFRLATHWNHEHGDIDGLMERAVMVKALKKNALMSSLILQTWVEGPYSDYPVGFLVEIMSIED